MTFSQQMLEHHGVEQIPLRARSGSLRSQSWLWAAANLNPFVIAYGFFAAEFGLSWQWAAVAVVVGCAVGYGLLGLVAVVGARGGRPTMALSQSVFGRTGNFLPGAASCLALLGWSAVNLVLAVLAAVSLYEERAGFEAGGRARLVCFAAVAPVVLMIAFFGYRLLMAVQRWIALLAFTVVAGYAVLTAHLVHLPESSAAPGLAALTGGAVFALAAGGLAWVMAGADYSRYLPASAKASSVAGWTALGGGLPAALLMLYGVLLCASRPELVAGLGQDPVGALASLVPPWSAAVFLSVTAVGFMSNAAINLYSSGLSLLALGVRLRRPVAVVANGALVLAAAGYVVFVSPGFSVAFESFLDILGVPIAAWCAVFLSEFARGSEWSMPACPARATGNTGAVVLASLVGFGLITSRDPVLRPILGWLFTEHAKQSGWGAANVGVPVAFVLAWALSRVFSPRSEGTSAR
ncbi:MAG: purine-cytosine permease family protein [Segniliparus sp.]|uniref:purine-cytosine permease family protein n=1 Tax=Segniliparus sp. TaxID=2804064 RepID=UPI003F361C86